MLTQVIQMPEQQHYLAKLLGFSYEIRYKLGASNIVADALSRSLEPNMAEIHSLSVPQFTFLAELKKELAVDPFFTSLCDKLTAEPQAYPELTLRDGLILRKGKIWLSPSSKFRSILIREYHETPMGGHAGMAKTLQRLAANFYWVHMKSEVQEFIRQCSICQQTKYSTQKPGGLLQPLPLPSNIWEDVSMDFITGLPPSHGYTVILVVVDRFSKGIHLSALPTGFSAYKVAELFVSIFCRHHGLPKSIVSDHDPIFISHFWSDLFKFSGTLLRMSSSYHPQTDDQTEVMNRMVEQYLRAYVHDKPSHWFKYLPWVEYHYNTSTHSASGLSPF